MSLSSSASHSGSASGSNHLYLPKDFQFRSIDQAYKIIEENCFATLLSTSNSATFPDILASHLPIFLHRDSNTDEKGKLYGHFANANPHFKLIEILTSSSFTIPVMIIFMGPDAYISASWYSNPKRNVPTWNYSVVHIRGNLKLLKNKKDLEWILSELAKRNERDLINLTSRAGLKNKEHKEWNYNELDEKYKNLQHNAITGFEIEIKEIIGKNQS